MKTIQDRFIRWGDEWIILERIGDVALLLQAGRNFNVVIIQRSGPREIKGNLIEGGEYLPGENQYGRIAWNFGTCEGRAREKFNNLVSSGK